MAGQVGSFPGLRDIMKRQIKAPVNPLDKSTIISIWPKPVHEVKHTIEPGIFNLAPGSVANPSILIVGPSSWWKRMEESEPDLEIPQYSTQIAHSVVQDYCNGMLMWNETGEAVSSRSPGLFWVPGCQFDKEGNPSVPFTIAWIKTVHSGLLEKAVIRQRNWYHMLVQVADSLWSRSNSNPLCIDDNMRLAAQELSLKNKPWMQDFTSLEMRNCPYCGFLYNPLYPMCQHCRTIVDKEKYAKLGGEQAKTG